MPTVSAEASAILIMNKTWTAGVLSYFEIECRDEFGNQIQETPGFAKVTISSTASSNPVSSFINSRFVEQLFRVLALVTQTGTYFVSVYLADIVFRPFPL